MRAQRDAVAPAQRLEVVFVVFSVDIRPLGQVEGAEVSVFLIPVFYPVAAKYRVQSQRVFSQTLSKVGAPSTSRDVMPCISIAFFWK